MATRWSHADYIDYDPGSATWLQKIRQHIKEVSEAIDTDVTSDGQSESAGNLVAYLQQLRDELRPFNGGAVVAQKIQFGNTRGR